MTVLLIACLFVDCSADCLLVLLIVCLFVDCSAGCLQAWLNESEEVTWDRLAEALEAIKEKDVANRVREKYPPQEEIDTKDSDENIVRAK